MYLASWSHRSVWIYCVRNWCQHIRKTNFDSCEWLTHPSPLGLWLGVVAIPVALLCTYTHSYGVLTGSCCHSAHGTCTLCKQNGGHDECVVPITIIPLLGLVVSFVPNSKTGIRICQCNHRHYMGQYSTCIYCAALDSCFSPCVGPHQCSVWNSPCCALHASTCTVVHMLCFDVQLSHAPCTGLECLVFCVC